MRFPIIKIKDTDTGSEHIVGTDMHDSLRIKNDGQSIMYFNYQNVETSGENGCYRFTGTKEDFTGLSGTYETHVEFVAFEELTKLYEESVAKEKEKKELLQKLITEFDD